MFVFLTLDAETFHTNPQVYFVLRDINTDDDNLSSCLVAIMHKEKEQGEAEPLYYIWTKTLYFLVDSNFCNLF